MRKVLILIDDDKISNVINRKVVEKFCSNKVEIHQYSSAWDALDYLYEVTSSENLRITILLDINMPGMNGWDVLNEVRTELDWLPLTVHVLSSSVDPEDRKKAENYSMVESFISKPLNTAKLKKISGNLR